MPTITGTVRDVNGNLVSGRTVRVYRRSTGDLVGSASSAVADANSEPNTSLILQFNGTNGQITFPDTSPNNFTMTRVGTPSITTSEFLYGNGSLNLAGGSNYLTTPSSTTFAFGTGSFTIEAWVKCNSHLGNIFSSRHLTDGITFRVVSNRLEAFYGGGIGAFTANANHSVGVWFHAALVKDGNSVRMYQNGILVGSSTWTGISVNGSTTADVNIGSWAGSESFVGHIDSLRITKGVARYSSDFTPSEFTNNTVLTLGQFIFDVPNTDDYIVVCNDNTGTRNDIAVRVRLL